jgi:RNA polymerase sigma-70 factor (ECF subfamily)
MRAPASRLAQRTGVEARIDAIAAWLESAGSTARERWPRIELDAQVFADHVADQLEPGRDVEAELQQLHADELFLACACGHGDPAALEALEAELRPLLRSVLADPKAAGVDAEDLRQMLLERLLVGDAERRPKILDYGGRGRLRTWLKVAATRLRIDQERRRTGQAVPLEDDSLQRIEDSVSADMEVALLKQRYRSAFKEAFQAVLRSLEPEQRTLLRLTVVEGLSATEIARSHGVHRATAKRWLVGLRAHLLEQTERRLASGLGVGETELRSVLGLIRSNLEVSMKRHLEGEP